jgi:hypothetical protein
MLHLILEKFIGKYAHQLYAISSYKKLKISSNGNIAVPRYSPADCLVSAENFY